MQLLQWEFKPTEWDLLEKDNTRWLAAMLADLKLSKLESLGQMWIFFFFLVFILIFFPNYNSWSNF